MKTYYQDKWVTIYHGDCREILPQLDVKVDLVLTDPPYMLPHVQFRPNMREQTRTWGNFSVAQAAFDSYLCLINRLEPKEMYWFLDEVSYPVLYPILYTNSYSIKMLIWDKGRIGMGGKWRRQFELIAYVSNQPNDKTSGRSDILKIPSEPNKEHPFQKPVDLVETLIEASPENSLILDPFLGSGTTCYCAKNLNRCSIGIEIEEKYCEIAAKRCCQEVMELA